MSDSRRPDVVTVAVTRVDGGVTVLRVITAEYEPDGAGGRRKRWEIDPTPEHIDAIIAKHDWQGDRAAVSWRIVPDDFSDEATDRTFRDAWMDDGGKKPGVDMGKARDIHRRRLRIMRFPVLEALDADYMKADEASDQQTKKRIAARKQALRDVPADPAIDKARTPDELKAVIPAALTEG
jgi:hypothetical protein